MREPDRRYYSKIILFGEYTIITGSQLLSVPYRRFSAGWTYPRDGSEGHRGSRLNKLQQVLRDFSAYLRTCRNKGQLGELLDLDRFESDLGKGLFFDSDIPGQYGLGSSGALCAAVYDRYVRSIEPSLSRLKEVFSVMESFFHGTSSGIDPLTCHADHPLLVLAGGRVSQAFLPADGNRQAPCFFLVDTSARGDTAPLVSLFRNKYREPGFKGVIDKELIPVTESCIKRLLNSEYKELLKEMQQLSQLQLSVLPEMIPSAFHQLWQEGIRTRRFSLKLCGSGGGGYLLGLGRSLNDIRDSLAAFDIRHVPLTIGRDGLC